MWDKEQTMTHGYAILTNIWPARKYWCRSWTTGWILAIDDDCGSPYKCYYIDALVFLQLLVGAKQQPMIYGYAILAKFWPARGYWCSSWTADWIIAIDNDPENPYIMLPDRCLDFITAIDGGQGTNHEVWLCNLCEKMTGDGVLMQLPNHGLHPREW